MKILKIKFLSSAFIIKYSQTNRSKFQAVILETGIVNIFESRQYTRKFSSKSKFDFQNSIQL